LADVCRERERSPVPATNEEINAPYKYLSTPYFSLTLITGHVQVVFDRHSIFKSSFSALKSIVHRIFCK
jgi:hypothetical protein